MVQSTTTTPACDSFTFTVLGKPAPQGSKRHVGKGVMVESSNRVKPWRLDVKHTALGLLPSHWHAILDKPMAVTATFIFARPKNHFRANGQLKPAAPKHCTSRVGDVDKLSRSILDALSEGVIFNDDAQVVSLIASRRYANDSEQPSAIITVTAIT